MGLLTDVLDITISALPLIIGGVGIGFIGMIGSFVFFEIIEAFEKFIRSATGRTSTEQAGEEGVLDPIIEPFEAIFRMVKAVVELLVDIVKIPIQLGSVIIDNIDKIGDIFECILDLFYTAVELFIEYYSIIMIMALLVPAYLGLYYIGNITNALID